MRKFLAVLPAIVFLFASCDTNPMTDIVIQDPVTVRFYNGETLFREVTVQRGADVAMPNASPSKQGHDFLFWYRLTAGGEERTYREGQTLRTDGMPPNLDAIALYARFMNVAFPHEVSNVSHSTAPFIDPDAPPGAPPNPDLEILTFTWTSPTDASFFNVRIFDGTRALSDDRYVAESKPGENSVAFLVDWFHVGRAFFLRAVDVHGNMSRGVWHETPQNDNPDW